MNPYAPAGRPRAVSFPGRSCGSRLWSHAANRGASLRCPSTCRVVVALLDDDIDADNIPAETPQIEGYVYSMLGPIPPEATAGNTSENIDVWGPGTGSSIEPPEGREPVAFNFPSE